VTSRTNESTAAIRGPIVVRKDVMNSIIVYEVCDKIFHIVYMHSVLLLGSDKSAIWVIFTIFQTCIFFSKAVQGWKNKPPL
jgi:hypothetical protein